MTMPLPLLFANCESVTVSEGSSARAAEALTGRRTSTPAWLQPTTARPCEASRGEEWSHA